MATPDLRRVMEQARGLLAAGRGEDAKSLLQRAIRGIPPGQRPAPLLVGLSTVHFHLGDIASAEQVLRDCLALHPANADALSNLGAVLDRQGRYEEAAQARSAAARLDPRRGAGGSPPGPAAPARSVDPPFPPMSDFSLPATKRELREFERRLAAKNRAEFRAGWQGTPWFLKIFTVIVVVVFSCFFLTLITWGLATLATS